MSAPEIAETDSEISSKDSSLFLAVTIISSKVVALFSVDSAENAGNERNEITNDTQRYLLLKFIIFPN